MTGARNERGRRLPRERRITRGSEIRDMFKRGKRSRTLHLDVLDSESPASYARVGVVVPKYGHTAVRRNVLKRRLKEILRHVVLPRLDEVSASRNILVRARREAYDARYVELSTQLMRWVEDRWPASS